MTKLIKLIEEYGKLENELGQEIGKNEILLFGETEETTELRNKRTEKYIQLQKEVLRLNKEFQMQEEAIKCYSKFI